MSGTADDKALMAVFLAWMRVQPEVLGVKKCRKRGVGALLRELRGELSVAALTFESGAKREAAQIVESHCRLCGKCSMAGE